MAPVKVPPNLPELVRTAFNKARASGDVNFYPTQVTILNVNSIPFQLRFSPSLANKPKSNPSGSDSLKDPSKGPSKVKTKPFDPFENPSPIMLIAPLPPDYNLVLNKFAIVPEHFILTTKEFAEQTDLLGEGDLLATMAVIRSYSDCNHPVHGDGEGEGEGQAQAQGQEQKKEKGGGLFAFFNSGDASGASQPHRHIQLLPIERMRDGLSDDTNTNARREWEVLANRLVDEQVQEKLPFRVFVEEIHEAMDGKQLREVYLQLYRKACESAGLSGGADRGQARVSYNLAMTSTVMVVMPRVAEGGIVTDGDEEVGRLALNGTVLAGTALVKTQREWDVLRGDPGQVGRVLGRIGVGGNGGGGRL